MSPREPSYDAERALSGVGVVERVGEHSMACVGALTPSETISNTGSKVAFVALEILPIVALERGLDDDELHGFIHG
jgi:hypothetical protein